jgi:hypothetical protein
MKHIPQLAASAIAVTLTLGAGAANAQSQINIDDLMAKAHLSMAAFKCAHLAAKPNEQDRLLALGYSAGMDFLKQREANPQLSKDVSLKLPFGWWDAGGPNFDFILGRMYERMNGFLERELGKDELRTPAHLEIVRSNLYGSSSCRALR